MLTIIILISFVVSVMLMFMLAGTQAPCSPSRAHTNGLPEPREHLKPRGQVSASSWPIRGASLFTMGNAEQATDPILEA